MQTNRLSRSVLAFAGVVAASAVLAAATVFVAAFLLRDVRMGSHGEELEQGPEGVPAAEVE